MRVLLFLPSFGPYEERVRAYMKGTEEAEKVIVLTPHASRESALAANGIPANWEVRYLPRTRKIFLGPWIRRNVVALVRDHRIDIVHDHFYYMVWSFRRLRGLTTPPVNVESIYIFNREWFEKTRWSLPVLSLATDYSRLRSLPGEWASVRESDYLVLQAESLRDGIKEHYRGIKSRMLFLPNAVDHERFHPGEGDRSGFGFPAGSIVILSVGSIGYRRGTDVSLRAFSLAAKTEPRLRLVIAGNHVPGDKKSLMKLLGNHGLADKVLFLGHVARGDMPNLYRKVDALLLTSYQEGMPRVVLEAMSSGLPVAASHLPGVHAIDPAYKCTFLVPPGDSEGFAEALLCVAGDPENRLNRGRQGRAIVEARHTIEKNGDAIAEMYRYILKERTGGNTKRV